VSPLEPVEYIQWREFEGIKTAEININGIALKIVVLNDFKNQIENALILRSLGELSRNCCEREPTKRLFNRTALLLFVKSMPAAGEIFGRSCFVGKIIVAARQRLFSPQNMTGQKFVSFQKIEGKIINFIF
jgi:hypothetical protein